MFTQVMWLQRHGARPTLPPSVLPDISPTWGETGSFAICARSATSMIDETQSGRPISLLVGEMSGRTEGGAKERNVLLMSCVNPSAVEGREWRQVFQPPPPRLGPLGGGGPKGRRGRSWPYAIALRRLGSRPYGVLGASGHNVAPGMGDRCMTLVRKPGGCA